jgi:hypothetical protein
MPANRHDGPQRRPAGWIALGGVSILIFVLAACASGAAAPAQDVADAVPSAAADPGEEGPGDRQGRNPLDGEKPGGAPVSF